MKVIVVEGESDALILKKLFPEIDETNICIKSAGGFSNVLATARAYVDYGCDVMLVMDTDTNVPGIDNRKSFLRLSETPLVGRFVHVVWMDPYIEAVLSRIGVPIQKGKQYYSKMLHVIDENIKSISELKEFRDIYDFVK